MTQNEMVIGYIKDFGSISSKEAFDDLGITRLAGRIFDLKQRGYKFITKVDISKNRYGKPVKFARYSLKEERNESS